jgi:hypothetical protein
MHCNFRVGEEVRLLRMDREESHNPSSTAILVSMARPVMASRRPCPARLSSTNLEYAEYALVAGLHDRYASLLGRT